MSIGEQVILRVFLFLVLMAAVFCFRLIKALIIKGWKSLTNSGGKPQISPQVPPQVNQPSAPPVISHQPEAAAGIPQYHSAAEPRFSHPPQDYVGTIPLDPDTGGPFSFQPPAAGPSYSLKCIRGPMQGRSFPLNGGGWRLGRDGSCNILFPPDTAGISRRHCKVDLVNGKLLLMDAHSTYGTYLGNGTRLHPGDQYPIETGAAFFLGSVNGPGFVVENH